MFENDFKVLNIDGGKLKTTEGTSEIITEVLRTIIPTSVNCKISSKKDRQLLIEKCGEKAFLDPDQLKFPVMNPTTGKYDCSLIYAAKIRSKQYLGIKPGYREIHSRACELYKKYNCGEKLRIRIQEGNSVIDTNLTQIMEIFF